MIRRNRNTAGWTALSLLFGLLTHVVRAAMPALARLGPRTVAALVLGIALCTGARAQDDMDEFDDDEVVSVNIAAAREQLKQVLPPGATREEETRFLLQRERAAFALGASKVRLEALRRLVELHKATPEVHGRYSHYLWREEWRSGNQQRAFEMGEELLAQAGSSLSARLSIAAHMGVDYLQIGQIAKAQTMLRRTESLLDEYRRTPQPVLLDREVAYVERLRSRVLQSEARFPAADGRGVLERLCLIAGNALLVS